MLSRDEVRKKYTLWRNVKKAFRDIKIMGYRYYAFLVLDILTQVFVPFLLILVLAGVVNLLQSKTALSEVLIRITMWIGGILILNLVHTYVHQKFDNMVSVLTDVLYWRKLHKKVLSCDLKQLEDDTERDRLHEVTGSLQTMDGIDHYSGVRGFYLYGTELLINVVGFLLYASLAGKLHLLLLIVLFSTSVLNCYVKSKAIHYQFEHINVFWINTRKFWYLKQESINTEKTKDIRMYHMYNWFERSLDLNVKEATGQYDDVHKHHFYSKVIIRITSLIRDGFAYGFLIYQLMTGSMDVVQFLLYIGIVAGFGTWVSQIIDSYTYLRKISDEIAIYREYVGDKKQDEVGKEIEIPTCCHSIVFDDVSFSYGDQQVIEHFTLTIKSGEKVALVGVNGAGKTTLMKLLCGLYPLNGGKIIVDGKDIATLNREDYYRYISILFQDVHVLPFSIAKNIACAWTVDEKEAMDELMNLNPSSKSYAKVDQDTQENNVYEEDRIVKCLKQAKLWDKVQSLPLGIHTSLTKILDPSGMQLSGGEMQRLMLARALYKDTPILILDEPTAALDPIAESELYEEYASLCEDKISIFISHRLSSTRFCDRILFLEQGKIVEEGNHEALMSKNGKYADMYRIQSHYYQKEVERVEAGI